MEETQNITTQTADSIRNDFIRALKLFSRYLKDLQQTRKPLPEISKDSETILKNWNNTFEKPKQFLYQGTESSSVFIVDSYDYLFNGESGALLKKILAAMTLSPESVFICNCGAFFAVEEKIRTVNPKVIISLGEKASQTLLKSSLPLEKLRGRFHDFKGIHVMPSFHPAILLKNQALKRYVWEDMKQVMKFMGLNHDSK
jgi:hypothetical protein